MMIMTLFNLINLTIYFNLTRCASEEMETEEMDVSENQRDQGNLLSFSFDKNNLKGFRCNFDDKILSDDCLKRKPFHYSKPVRNFISIFCLIFQYSQIMSNEEFRNAIESSFKQNLNYFHDINGEKSDFVYNPQTFIDHFQKINYVIGSLVNEKKTNMVSIEERGDQIIITQNNDSSEDFNFHFLDSFLDVKCPNLENNEIADAMFKYTTKFYEMYLEGLFKDKFSLSLSDIYGFESKNKRERVYERKTASEDDKEELNNLFSKFCQLVNIESQKERGYGNKFVELHGKYMELLRAMHLCRKLPGGLSGLLLKGMAKHFFECSENITEIEYIMPGLSGAKNENMAIREILKKALRDTNEISYENTSLSAESFDNLVKQCLELVV